MLVFIGGHLELWEVWREETEKERKILHTGRQAAQRSKEEIKYLQVIC